MADRDLAFPAVPQFVTATVAAVLAERTGLQRVELSDGDRAYVLTGLIGPVAPGDRVVVNTTAVELGLGTGGWHVVHWNLSRDGWSAPGGGHVMKLRYTSLQTDTGVAEEDADAVIPDGLAGTPVVVCDLHSQVGCVAAAFVATRPGAQLVFVMTDSAALPLALSDLVAELRAAGRVAATVTCGQAFGGDVEAVNVVSGLLLASTLGDAVVVGPGPGVVGTRTRFGFGGLEGAAIVDAAHRRGGRPVVCVRWSDADARPSHRGVSHHTATVLAETGSPALIAVPTGGTIDGGTAIDSGRHDAVEVDVPDFADLDLGDLTVMGRGVADDPGFFRWSAAAGVLAARLVSG